MSKWENYGDVNPIEHGAVFVKKDAEIEGRCYYVVKLIPMDDEEKWLFYDGYIDLDDDWIELVNVIDTCWTPEPYHDIDIAVDCMHYYGNHLSNGVEEIIDSREAVEKRLKDMEIEF